MEYSSIEKQQLKSDVKKSRENPWVEHEILKRESITLVSSPSSSFSIFATSVISHSAHLGSTIVPDLAATILLVSERISCSSREEEEGGGVLLAVEEGNDAQSEMLPMPRYLTVIPVSVVQTVAAAASGETGTLCTSSLSFSPAGKLVSSGS